MFNQLPHNQQQNVVRIVNALDETVKDLRPITAELMPDSSYTNHLELVCDMVAHIVLNNDGVADADELGDILPRVAEALTFTATIMADYIKQDDTLPLEYTNDMYILVSTSHEANYYWQDLIKNNLSLMSNAMPDTPNVSAAIFKAVVNTAFACTTAD